MDKDNMQFPTYFTKEHALSMTVRDYFAAHAMQGMLAHTNSYGTIIPWNRVSFDAYALADAMLEERKKK